ncbi:SUKH-4 family immunity protein [Streptomyces sp. NPDC003688]
MVTFAQAQERAEEWINGDVPAYQHREVRVREFELGFVVWGEDRAEGPRVDAGAQRLVIARDSGEATLWPALPVGEVIRRYEETYGRPDEPEDAVPVPAAARVDLNQTSFLLSPPEWLQEAAEKLGAPSGSGAGSVSTPAAGTASGSVPSATPAAAPTPTPAPRAVPEAGPGSVPGPREGSGSGPGGGLAETRPGVPVRDGSGTAWPPAGAEDASRTPWAGTDTNADEGEDRSVPLPATVFSPPVGDGAPRPPASEPGAETALMSGGSQLPPTAVTPEVTAPGAVRPGYAYPPGGDADARPGRPVPPDAGDIADAVTSKAAPPPRKGQGAPPPPPSAPGTPGARPGGAAGDEYVPTQLVSALGPEGRDGVAPPATSPGASQRPAPGMPPGVPPVPGAPLAPRPAGAPGADHAETVLAAPPVGGPGVPPPPQPAPGFVSAPGARPQPGPSPAPGTPPAQGTPPGSGAPSGPGTPPAPGVLSGPGAPHPAPSGPTPPSGAMPPPAGVVPQPGGVTPPPPGSVPPGAMPPPSGPAPTGPAPSGAMPYPGAMPPPGAVPPPPGATPPPGVMPPPGAPPHLGAPPGAVPPPGAMPPHGAPLPPPGAPVPGRPPAYGYPPPAQPTVGPGYQAVLRYRAQDGSEQQLIRRSAPGMPHPEWQIFHELRAMNVPPDQVLELHTELESCELPGAYCARMIREQWPQARIASIAPYGTDHASRQQGMQELLAHQGELHQVADGPARPAPVRAPLPPVQPAAPVPPEGVAHELAAAFGPGVHRFDQQAVSRQGVPPVVAHTLVVAGLPLDMGPFFWAQAQPGRPVPTLAELAAERGVRSASDAGSYLVMGTDFGKAICVQYGTANIVAVPVESGPGGSPVPPQFVNTGLVEFTRCLALLGRMWRLRYGLNQEQAGRWTVDFQAQLASLDPAALGSPETWWSVLLEQMWDGLL